MVLQPKEEQRMLFVSQGYKNSSLQPPPLSPHCVYHEAPVIVSRLLAAFVFSSQCETCFQLPFLKFCFHLDYTYSSASQINFHLGSAARMCMGHGGSVQ